MTDIDTRVSNALASQLANENLQLRQDVIRLSIENQDLMTTLTELKSEDSDPDESENDEVKPAKGNPKK